MRSRLGRVKVRRPAFLKVFKIIAVVLINTDTSFMWPKSGEFRAKGKEANPNIV